MRTMLGVNFKSWMAFCLGLFVLGMVGCGENPKQMFETAQFEELQNNHSHARELYEQIVQADPNSNLAKKAKERLAALQMKEQR